MQTANPPDDQRQRLHAGFLANEQVRSAKHFHNLLKQLVAWIENLAEVIHRIVAMLADQQYGIDVEPFPTERLRDGLGELNAVPLANATAEVVFRIRLPDALRAAAVISGIPCRPCGPGSRTKSA